MGRVWGKRQSKCIIKQYNNIIEVGQRKGVENIEKVSAKQNKAKQS